MPELPLLAVRGEVAMEVDPEIARIGLTVSAKDPDRAKTLRLLNERAVAIDRMLAGFGDAIERIETSGVRVSPQVRFGKTRERVTGYQGVVNHTITVADFDRLGELVAQLADHDLTDISGPWWALRPDSPVYRLARVEAVQDATKRARDYAHALGSELTELVQLADAGLLSDGQGPQMHAFSAVSRATGVAPDEFTFDISPTKQVVRAAVEARFRITAPDLSKPV